MALHVSCVIRSCVILFYFFFSSSYLFSLFTLDFCIVVFVDSFSTPCVVLFAHFEMTFVSRETEYAREQSHCVYIHLTFLHWFHAYNKHNHINLFALRSVALHSFSVAFFFLFFHSCSISNLWLIIISFNNKKLYDKPANRCDRLQLPMNFSKLSKLISINHQWQ